MRLPPGTDPSQAIAFLPGLTIPYAWIGAMERPAELPDGHDLVGSSSFTGTVVLNFDSGETATVLHSSPGVSLSELSFSAERNGSFPEGIELDQLLPISLILERVSDGTVRALGSRNGVQVTFTLRYAPNGIQFPLLNLTLEASATDATVDPLDGSTVLTFSTTSRLSEVPIQTIGGSITGRTDDGVVLPTARVTAYADRLRDGKLNWEIADLPGTNAVGSYRPLLPAIALSAAWLNAQETPERLMDGREATGDGRIQATVIIQYPQGQTLTLQSTSTGLSPEQPDSLLFDVVVSGSYPADDELSIGQTLSVPLQQTALGVLSGQQNLEQGVIVTLTITYQPLAPQAVPATLLLLQLTPAEVDTTGQTPTIKFSAVAELQLIQLTTVVAPTATPTTSATPAVVPTLSPTPKPTPTPPAQVDRLNGSLDSLAVSASRDPAQDGKLDWNVRLPPGTDPSQAIAFLPGLTIPYAWIGAMERPAELPDGHDLVGSSSFTGTVVLNFDSGETATVLHSSPGVSLSELSFSAERNGSFPEGIELDQLLPISLILERVSDGTVRALGSRNGVQVTFTLRYAPNGIQFPLLNLTLEASATDATVDPLDGSTVLTFSTTSRLSEVPIQTIGGSITGRTDDGVVLPTARVTAYADRLRDGKLNWEIADLPGTNAVGSYRPLLPAIALSAAWLNAQETPERLMDGREATGDGRIQATVIIQYPQGQTLTLQSTSTGLSPEQPDSLLFDVVVSGSYPADDELSIGQTLSVPLQQTALGVLSGQQNLEQGVIVTLTITYQPLAPQAVPATLLLLQLTPAEVDTTGQTPTIKFSAVAELQLIQLPTVVAPTATPTTSATPAVVPTLSPTPKPTPTPPAQVDRLNGSLDSLAVSASRDPAQDGKLDWNVRLPPGTDPSQAIAFLPGLTIPYAWIGAMERPAELPDGHDLVGSSSFTGTVVLNFDSGETATVLHSSPGVSLSELSFSAERNGSFPEGIELDQLLPISLILERVSDGTVRALGSRNGVQVTFTLRYAPNGIQFPLLNLTLEASATDATVDPLDGSTVLTFSTTSRLSEVPIQTIGGSITGRTDDGVVLPTARVTAYADRLRDGKLNWEIADLPGTNAVGSYRPLLPAIALSAAWLNAQETPERLMDGREATGDGRIQATVIIQYPQGQTLTLQSTSTGLSPEQPDSLLFDVVVSGSYPADDELSIGQTLSVPLQQTALGVLSGQQNLEQGVIVTLTITYQPLAPQAVPATLLLLQLTPAEVDTTGQTPTIKFSAVAELQLIQLTTVVAPTATPTTSATPAVVPTLSPTPKPTPTPPAQVDRLNGSLDSLAVSASRDPAQDGKLDWNVRLPPGTDPSQAIAFLPGLTIPYAWIGAMERPAELPDGHDLVGSSSFTGTVVLNFDSGETATVLHSSPGVSLSELSFSAERNGSFPEGIELDQLLPISLILERVSDGTVRALGSRNGVQVTFTLRYAPNGIQFPLLNLTLEASATDATVDPLDGSTVLTFSTTSRLSEVPIQTIGGSITGRTDDGVVLPTARVTAYADRLRDGKLNWEIADLPGTNAVGSYRPLLPAIALSAAWLNAQETPERLMDGREATGDGRIQATVIIQYPQGQTLTLQSTSTGLSPEQPDSLLFDVVVSGSYPADDELSIGQTLSVPLQQTALGVLSGQQNLEQGVIVTLTITYQPLAPQAVPATLLLLQLTPAEVDTTGQTPTIKFSAVAELQLIQLPTVVAPTATPTTSATPAVVPTLSPTPKPTPTPPAQVDRLNGSLDSLAVSASRDPAQDGKLDWNVRLPPGTDPSQAIAFLPGLTIPYAWIGAMERPAELPDGHDLVGSSSFTGTVVLNFDSGETATVLHSSPGVSLSELSFSAERNGSFPEGIELDQLLPISLILERVSDGTVRALGSRNGVQVTFTLRYAPNGIQFPLLNLTLEASATDATVDPLDGSTVLTFSTTSRLSEVPIQTIGGSITGRTDDGVVLPTARVTAYADRLRDGKLNWEIADLPGTNAVGSYRPLLPAIALSAAWLNAQETPERLMDGREATGDGRIQATVIIQYPQGQTLTLQSTSTGLSPEQPDSLLFDVVVSGSYPADDELSIGQTLSVPLQQTALGVLSGQQNLEQGVIVTLTITYQPLAPQAVPATLLLLQLTPAEVDTTGQTPTIKFSAVAELQLIQLTTVVAPTATPTTSATPAVVPTLSPTPKPTPTPPAQVDRLNGSLDSLAVSASRDPAQDGKLDWNVRLPPGTDPSQAIAFLPGLTIPYAWIGAMERPAELPDGHDLVGSSSFTGTVVLNFDSGETATVLHSSPGVSLSELSFSAERNGSFPEGIELDQLLPISLILERVSDGTVRALGSRNGVQVTFTLRYAPNGIQFPLLNLTLEASATDATVDPLDGSTVLTFSTTSRLSEVPIQTIGGSITGRTDDGVVLPTARVTAYADRLRDGKLNWEIADLPGTNAVGSYRPLLPAIALSAAWLNAQETPERLMDGREATGDGRIQATVIIQYPQGQTLTLQSTSTGLSPEQPDSLLFDVVVSGSYPADDELSIGQTLSVPLQQTALGVLSGQQNLEQGVIVTLTITYQPLAPQAVPATLLLLQLTPAEVDTTGQTPTIKFSAVAELQLIQLTTVVAPTATPTTSATPAVVPTLSPTPKPTPTPPAQVDRLNGSLDSLAVSASRDPAQDGKLDWNVRLPPGTDPSQAIAFLPGLTIPYAWIGAMERPAELPDGHDLVGSSSFTGTVVLNFDSGETATVLHSSPGVSLSELSFSAERNGSFPEGIELDQLLPISLILERVSDGTVRALGSRNGVQVTFTLRYAPNGIQFPLLNLTLEASATDATVDPLDGSTVLTFSTTSRLSEVPIQTIGGSITGRTDDGVVLPTARVTAYADRLRDGKLNWEIADLPGTNAVGSYRPLLPAIALSAAWLNAQETPERLMDGREATGDGRIQATVIIQYPQGQTLTLQSTSTGLSPEQPDRLLFDVVVSGSYPADDELSIGQTLSVPLQQTALGVLSGQQNLEQGVIVTLTITYQPLAPQAVPATLLLLQLTPAEVDTTGQTPTIKFSAVAELQLIQLTTVVAPTATPTTSATPAVVPTLSPTPKPTPTPPAQVDRLNGSLDSLAVSASRDPAQDGKLDWNVRLPPGTDPSQAIAFLPGLTIPYAWIGAMERPAELPDGHDLVGSSSFTGTVVLNFDSGETATVLHSSPGVSLSELSFSAERNGSFPEGIELDQLLPISLILERVSDGTVRALGSRNGVQVTFTLRYAPNGIQFPLLNLTLEASATDATVDPLDGSTVLTFSTTSRLSEVPIQTIGGSITGRTDDGVVLPTARVTAYADRLRDGQLNWEIADLPGTNAVGSYRPLLPAIALSAAWLNAQETPERLMDGREATGDGRIQATVIIQYPQGQTLTLQSTSTGLSPEQPDRLLFDVVVSGSYPVDDELSIGQTLSVPLQQTALGVLSGQQNLEQKVVVSLTITYQPLSLQAVPTALLLLQLSPLEVDTTGPTVTIKFSAVAQLMLIQLPTVVVPTASPTICPPGYSGENCNTCSVGYYGNPAYDISCQKCDCNGNVNESLSQICDTLNGACFDCLNNTSGFQCDECKDGYWGDAVNGSCIGKGFYSVMASLLLLLSFCGWNTFITCLVAFAILIFDVNYFLKQYVCLYNVQLRTLTYSTYF